MPFPNKGRALVGQGRVGADFVQLAGFGAPFWEVEGAALAHDGARPLSAHNGEARGKVGGARRPLSRALGTVIDPRGTSAASGSMLPSLPLCPFPAPDRHVGQLRGAAERVQCARCGEVVLVGRAGGVSGHGEAIRRLEHLVAVNGGGALQGHGGGELRAAAGEKRNVFIVTSKP